MFNNTIRVITKLPNTEQTTLNAKKSMKITKGQSEYMYIVDVKNKGYHIYR